MDGLTKYTSLLSKTASIICELKTPVFDVQELPFKVVGGVCEYAFEGDIYEYADAHNIKIVTPALAYSKLIDLLDEAILELQSYEVKSELEECLSTISQTSLQTRLDNLSWRDFCGLESQNMVEFFSICKRSIKLYVRRSLIKDEATAKCTLIRLALVYADGKGDIPKVIYFLADKVRERGYSFKKGTFLHSLVNSYGVNFDDDYNTFELPQRAKGIFNEAIEAGLMEEAPNGHYKWLYGEKKGKVRLAFFLQQIFNPDGCSGTPYKELETLFQTKDLAQSTNQIGNWKQTPSWCDNILKITNKHLK